jgi:hypothetical protein
MRPTDHVFRRSFKQRRLRCIKVCIAEVAEPNADQAEALILAERNPLAQGDSDVRQLFAGRRRKAGV